MGGTPERLGRTWGEVREEEKWRLYGTGAPRGGWEREGFPMSEGTLGGLGG